MILNALDGQPLPIYGDGGNVRDWLHVDDHCAGLLLVLEQGRARARSTTSAAATSGPTSRSSIGICDALDALRPAASNPALGRPRATAT